LNLIIRFLGWLPFYSDAHLWMLKAMHSRPVPYRDATLPPPLTTDLSDGKKKNRIGPTSRPARLIPMRLAPGSGLGSGGGLWERRV
jgi:hypothetical protein